MGLSCDPSRRTHAEVGVRLVECVLAVSGLRMWGLERRHQKSDLNVYHSNESCTGSFSKPHQRFCDLSTHSSSFRDVRLFQVGKLMPRPQIARHTTPVMGTLSRVICPYGIAFFYIFLSSAPGLGTLHGRAYPNPCRGHGFRNFLRLGEQGRVFVVAQFVSTEQTTEVTNGRLEHAKCQRISLSFRK